MIQYALACNSGHFFEGWFRSSADFDEQLARHLLNCPTCGSHEVAKRLMAPNIAKGAMRDTAASQFSESDAAYRNPAGTSVPQGSAGVANLQPTHSELLERLRELKREIVSRADYVGEDFAEEARKIHYGEAKQRGIYGEASGEAIKDLADEGISVMPLPILPEDRN